MGRQSTPSMQPNPAAIMLGMCSLSDVAQEPSVLTPTSPKLSESGMAPMPKESNTIKKIRFMNSPHRTFFILHYLFSIATATSRATFIMVVKAVWRSSEVVSTPFST